MKSGCVYCGASGEGDLLDEIKRLVNCNNCVSDIHSKGNWTGDGFAAIKRLVERFGIEAVNEAWKKEMAERKKSL
jgi:hypothetical protein